jgi:hypothetical protein
MPLEAIGLGTIAGSVAVATWCSPIRNLGYAGIHLSCTRPPLY